MVKTKVWYKVKEFEGFPKLSDFKLVEEELSDELGEGEILTEAVAVSVDPFIRCYKVDVDSYVIGYQVAKVLKSNNTQYPVGSYLLHRGGWRSVCKVTEDTIWYGIDGLLDEDKPKSIALGVLGMPGQAAYNGFLELCEPKVGETVMINGCAGAVGSLVGQIAKIKGCTVLGCCGSDEKCAFAKSIGFDAVFNYKTATSWKDEISRIAPNGIDCFFDNVGGQMATDIINAMNIHGRIAVCGSISAYNEVDIPSAEVIQPAFIFKQLRMEGFIVGRFRKNFPKAVTQLSQWIREGKITLREAVSEGFENLPKAFIGILKGENIGKAVVHL